jgi:Arc/MetJ family transcription regulator
MTPLAHKPELEEEVDQDLVEQARQQLNIDSSAGAINTALRELVEARRERRLRAFDELQRN